MQRVLVFFPPLILQIALLGLVALAAGGGPAQAGRGDFVDAMREIESAAGGRIGVYAVDSATGDALSYRADERFAMASTFKPLLAAAVLQRVERGDFDLDETLPVAGVDVKSYSPVIETLEAGDSISIEALCSAAVSIGDNTATNMLLDTIGGPEAFTAYLRSLGDRLTRLDRRETELNENAPGDDRDTTTPRAITTTLMNRLNSDGLSTASRAKLRHWMVSSTTGGQRIRAGLPTRWTVGDKTGTGQNGAVNNIAVAWPGDGSTLGIAVYMSGSDRPVAELADLHATISRQVVHAINRLSP